MPFSRFANLWFLLILVIQVAYAQQNSYNSRMRLNSLDTLNRVACYDLELSSGSGVGWVLGSFNLSAYYDAEVACHVADSLLLDDRVYNYNIQSSIASTDLSTLEYRDSLGFLRINLDALDQPAEFDSIRQLIGGSLEWIPIIQICFDLKIDNILDPNTCMQFNFNTPDLQTSLGAAPDLMTEWGGGLVYIDVSVNQVENIVPDGSRNACFVFYENTPELCSDGIDNDENGLIDCLDTEGCAPDNFVITEPALSCEASRGNLIISGSARSEYSIDGGQNFSSDSIFTDIGPGLYDVVVQRNGIETCAQNQPVIIQQPNCENTDQLCSDGIDNDGDGLVDCDDSGCMPIIQDIIVSDPDNCPELNNGEISVVAGVPNQEISIDNGMTFQVGNFTMLSAGTYSIVLQNPNTGCQTRNEAILNVTVDCNIQPEICDDGIDNDLNGLIDCADQACVFFPLCELNTSVISQVYIANALSINSSINGRLTITPERDQVLRIEDFEIYDRWGNQVHCVENMNTNDPEHAWNGTFRGRPVSSGVYFYRVLLTSGSEHLSLSGDVTVIN